MHEKTITVTIDERGNSTLDLEGFAGHGCEKVSDDFRGGDVVKAERKKPRDSPRLACPGSAPLGLARPQVSLKGIRPGWVMLSQDTTVEFFSDDRTIRESKSNFVVELPFVGSLRVEGQRNAAVPCFFFRWVALDL